MPNLKITAMPSLAGNQVPTDLVTAVDLSAAPVNQNVKSTLNDLFSTITKNITDRAIRFQAPGSAPAVSSANQGALYHNGTAFLVSSNGGAYEQLYTLSAQSAALVFAGPTSGPAATPTFRALALTDLPSLATASLLGRISAGTGTPEQITSTAALLTWLQNPTSNNLSAAVTDATGPGGALVFANGPTLTNPKFDFIGAVTNNFGTNLLFTPSLNAVNYLEILNAVSGTGPTLRAAGSQTNVQLNLASKGNGIISAVGNQFRITSNAAGGAGILELRGGNASLSGGQIRLYEVNTNGTNYIGFQAPDSLASNLLFELPATDGAAGQAITTDGFGILSWASFAPIANPTFSGVVTLAAGTAAAPALTTTGDSNTGLAFPSADNLIFATGGLERLRIDNNGNVSIGALSPPQRRFSIEGVLPSATGVSVGFSIVGTSPTSTTSTCLAIGSNLSTAAASTLTSLIHYRAAQGTLGAGTTLTNQVGFEVLSNVAGATNNYGFSSAVPASATNYSFFSGAGAANSRFAGQVLHEAGSAAAPSITIDGDLNTGLAQIGGADTISISTGGTERLRAKSGGAIRFIPLAAAPGSPETGDVYYNSSTNKLQVYNGTIWQDCN